MQNKISGAAQPADTIASDQSLTSPLTGPVFSAQYSEVGDAAANISTGYTIAVGDQFSGNINSTSDADWIGINLTAGQTYVFTVWGTGGSAAGLDDTILNLYGSSGNLLATNDDAYAGGSVYFSLIEFTATTTGTYFLGVSAYGGETGNYTLQAATNVYTVDQVVTQLIDFGWGIPTPIAHDERTGDTMTVNISALTAAGQQLALWALEAWSVATGITFSTTTSTSADILFDDNQAGAFAGPDSYFPNTGEIVQASVNISTNWLSTYGTSIGSYSFLTYLHEIGHALGLVHSGNYNGSGSYATDAVFLNDSYQMTVMSYFDQIDNTFINADFAFPITPMIADIAAVARLYGTTVSAYAGNTVWGANSTVGGYLGTIFGYLFDGDTINSSIFNNGPVAFTIQDSSGVDTLDLSTTSTNNNVNLASGSILDVGGMIGNVVIAQGTVIENFIGGSGGELVIGNSAANNISGGAGFDTIDGGTGTDTIYGGLHADSLMGGDDDDLIFGEAGVDNLFGDAGHDSLNGGSENDWLWGGTGNDTMHGNSESDRLFGEAGDDELYGDGGFDRLEGGAGNDYLNGGFQADNLFGGDDNDTLYGEQGLDRLFGGNGDDYLDGGTENDGLFGEFGNDTIIGGAGTDRVFGGSGNDLIDTGADNDTVYGGSGFDTITGGAGDDELWGKFNADTFVFADGFGNDVIMDFNALNVFEKIDLSGVTAITDLADLLTNHASQVGGDVVIDDLAGNTITLTGVNLGDLDATDFIF